MSQEPEKGVPVRELVNQAELTCAVGSVVVNFSALEEGLHDAIWLLSGADNSAVHVLTAGMAFRILVEKLGALCEESGTARVPKEEVHEFCAHLQSLNQERNRIVHSAWAWDDDLVQRYKRTAKGRGGFSLTVSDVEIDEIRRFGLEIGEAVKKLWEIVPLEDEPAAGEG